MEGYDARFDPPLDKRLECPICLLAQREPMQTPCGHRFCSTCILRALRETGLRCPVDNTKVSNHQLFKDNFAKREVLSLNVKCSAEDCGCPWHGELRDLELHINLCDLVTIECPNCCGHSCQRKELCSHLNMCMNKPEPCLHCCIHFTRNKMEEHLPHCSKIVLPESIQSNLLKANEVLKWCGNIKLKINSQYSGIFGQMPQSIFQVSGYLTAKSDTPESFMFTGNWSSSLNVMPLNSSSSKIFRRMLHSPEVQTKSFYFSLLCTDGKSNTLSKALKKKPNDLSALVGLHLKSGSSRTDLTIIYFQWSDNKRRIVASVAELKTHLVKQIQNHLHMQQQQSSNRRNHRLTSPNSHTLPRNQSRSRSHARNSERPHHLQQQQQQFPPSGPAPPPPPPPGAPLVPGHIQHHHHHVHPHIHPRHPTAALALVTPGPRIHSHRQQQQSHPHSQHHHIQQAHSHQQHAILSSQLYQESSGQSSITHPPIISWQMSQSLNGYPWRMQTGNVPFFTFPSTPPSFIPANPYPYTFAPVPPFSINQIAQVPTTAVPVPSYPGMAAIPQATGVDSIVTGPAGATFPVAAIPSLTEVSNEQLRNVPAGAVAVTIASGNPVPGQPAAAAVVIQQPVIQPSQEASGVQNQDMAVIHTIAAPPPPAHGHYQASQLPAHIAPAIITADGTQAAGLIQNPGTSMGGEGVTVGRYAPIVAALSPQLIPVGTAPHMGMSLDHAVPSMNTNQMQVDQGTGVIAHEYQHGNIMEPVRTSGSHFAGSNAGTTSNSSRGASSSNAQMAVYNDGAGPSRTSDPASPSDNDSLDSNSPRRDFASMFYGNQPFTQFDNDSDDSSDNPIELESGDSMLFRPRRGLSDLSGESQISSDPEDSSSQSESESDSPTDPSTLRLINNNTTAIVVISPPSDSVSSPDDNEETNEEMNSTFLSEDSAQTDPPNMEASTSADESNPLSLPVLINISDSESPSSNAENATAIINIATSSSGTDSPNDSSMPSSSLPQPSGNNSALRAPSSNREPAMMDSNPYIEVGPTAPVFISVINQHNAESETREPHIVTRREAGRYFGANVSTQRPVPVMSDASAAATSNSQEQGGIHVVNHPVMQMARSHPHGHIPPQLYPQGHLPQSRGHLIQPHPQHPQAQGSHIHHSLPRDHAAQSVYPEYSSHLAGPGNSALEVPQMTALATPSGALVPLESNTPMAHSGVHVLRWPQPLSQQHQHHTGELMASHHSHPHHPSHPAAITVPSHLSSGFTSHHGPEHVVNTLHQQQAPTGNFWETVLPSLDMSLQNSGISSNETGHQ